MRKVKARIVSMLLVAALVLTILPMTVLAAGDVGMETGGTTANIAAGDIVYFGRYPQTLIGKVGVDNSAVSGLTEGTDYIVFEAKRNVPNDGYTMGDNYYFALEPIAWRVLENDSGELFLLSVEALDSKAYHIPGGSIPWTNSTVRSWLNGYEGSSNSADTDFSSFSDYGDNFIDGAFSSKEQAAISGADKIFLLSLDEVKTEAYGFANNENADAERVAINTDFRSAATPASTGGPATESGNGAYWWLRSLGSGGSNSATVYGDGAVSSGGIGVDHVFALRPALKLNLSSVLFTSDASGANAKSSATIGSGLVGAIATTGANLKMTVLDSGLSLTVTDTSALSKAQGETVALAYTGATTGSDKYISCVLAQSGAVEYYGKLAAASSAAGSVNITLPGDIATGSYTLRMFVEQTCEDEGTDFASTPEDITLTVTAATTPTISSITPTSGTTAGGTTVTLTGTNLTGATAVTVGGTPAASFSVDSDTQLTFTTPAGSAGIADVAVTTANGTGRLKNGFTYTYSITYENLFGATNNAANPASYTAESYDITLSNPGERSGYIFSGWYTSLDLSTGSRVEGIAIPSGSTGNIIFYAGWTPNGDPAVSPSSLTIPVGETETFTVSFGSSDATSATVVSDDTDVATVSTPTSTGGTVTVTGVEAGDTTITVTFDDTAETEKTVAVTVTEDVLPPHFDITFDPNGGTLPTGLVGEHSDMLQTEADGTFSNFDDLPTAARSGYRFDGWFTQRSGGVKISLSYVFTADTTVYAHWTATGSSSDNNGGSGGGGSSSSSGGTSVATPAPVTSFVSSTTMEQLKKTAAASNLPYILSRATGKTGISASVIANAAGYSFWHDTLAGNVVQVRLYISNPELVKSDRMLSGYVSGAAVDNLRARFEKYFSNKIRVIQLDQQTDWGQLVEIAAKVDLTGMDTNRLYFYSYNAASNTYRRIENPAYWIDSNGYLRFTTEYAGSIIISEGPLERK